MKNVSAFRFSRLSFFCFVLVGLLTLACSKNPVTGKRELMLMSEKQEIALGGQSDPDIVNSFGLYADSTLQRFITSRGERMARISHRPNLNYEFKVLDSPVINAFAVPGGYVYFTRGILAHFNNEAEFAGVLGHEIGHITARHSAKQYSKTMVAQVGLIVGIVTSDKIRQFADLAQTSISLLFLKFSRDNESESDQLGVEYSTRVGYDAHYMADFFKTLNRMRASSGGEAIPSFMSTHPDPADRYRRVGQLADKWQRDLNKTKLKVNRDSYLRMIDGLVYGEDPRQGFFENNRFYHPEMKFQFPIPNNWKTSNSPAKVQMAPESG
ncbi:MAG: M48 family metalloprotease, partial [Bacteroidota bacterium]